MFKAVATILSLVTLGIIPPVLPGQVAQQKSALVVGEAAIRPAFDAVVEDLIDQMYEKQQNPFVMRSQVKYRVHKTLAENQEGVDQFIQGRYLKDPKWVRFDSNADQITYLDGKSLRTVSVAEVASEIVELHESGQL